MFVKVFTQILDSSLADDYLVRFVFEDLLKLADKNGFVDMTLGAISRRTGVPLEIFARGIEKLSQPDPESRSPQEEGRRIVLLDTHRSWGWKLINYEHYRNIRDMDAKREADRNRQQRHREKIEGNGSSHPVTPLSHSVTPCHAPSQEVAYAYADADVSTLVETTSSELTVSDKRVSLSPRITDCWNYYIEKSGKNSSLYRFTESRQQKGMARMKECLAKIPESKPDRIELAVDLFKIAIDGLCFDPWCNGSDPKSSGKQYLYWTDHLCKSAEIFEKRLESGDKLPAIA